MDVIFPENLSCIGCKDHISSDNPYSLCKSCYEALETNIKLCRRCGRILGETGICFECESETYHFDCVHSIFKYNEALHRLMYIFKYGYGTYMGKPLGRLMSDYLLQNNIDFDYIVFVPISKKRYKSRGYNQGKLLADAVANNTGKPVLNCFKRQKDTKFLARLTGIQRRIEVAGAFRVEDENQLGVLKGKKVLLIDDIFTTGVTANEISKLIKSMVSVDGITVLTIGNAKSRRGK